MAKKTKTKTINLGAEEGAFYSIFSKIKSSKKNSDLADLRQLLSNEKARLLHVSKTKQPDSLYQLAKLLGRDFKAVRKDVKLLEKFGFIELISSHKKGKERLKPVVDVDTVIININL